MNKKILNEIASIKKMMGLITESFTFTNTSEWGINKENANQFIEKATQNGKDAFMFNGIIYQLKSLGENNPQSFSFDNENMVFNVGILTYGGTNGYPIIVLPGERNVQLESFPGGNEKVKIVRVIGDYAKPNDFKTKVSADSQGYNLKKAQEEYTRKINQVNNTLKNEINSFFGENLSKLKLG